MTRRAHGAVCWSEARAEYDRLRARSDALPSGHPDEDAAVTRGDWFTGGDLASLDSDGYLWFHGRNDDLMNALGYRVSPSEVEAVLARHPDVAEVGVAELAVRADLKVIAAFVVARAGASPDAAALIAFCGAHLAAYKCPREIRFLDALPRTANGKVQRKRLVAASQG